MIQFSCPQCGSVFSVSDEKAGKKGKCPKCSAPFQIPDAEKEPAYEVVEVVAIKPCPNCRTSMTVSPADLGLEVECSYCKKLFSAVKRNESRPAGSTERDEDQSPRRKNRSQREDEYDDSDEDEDEDEEQDERKGRRRSSWRDSVTPRRGTVTMVGVFSIIMSALTLLLCFFSSFIISMELDDFIKEMGIQNTNVKSQHLFSTLIIGFLKFVVSVLLLVSGLAVLKRKPYGRMILLILPPLAVAASLFTTFLTFVRYHDTFFAMVFFAILHLIIWLVFTAVSFPILISNSREFQSSQRRR